MLCLIQGGKVSEPALSYLLAQFGTDMVYLGFAENTKYLILLPKLISRIIHQHNLKIQILPTILTNQLMNQTLHPKYNRTSKRAS